ncbi:hypothetical protein WJX73_005104 [Symbiochloris irregularis]|uniref:Uncharacterized protein n=1 Tax=Symbiochloris irregularis TaxID=706552 RepID=A0AAW1PAE4_9CHLO
MSLAPSTTGRGTLRAAGPAAALEKRLEQHWEKSCFSQGVVHAKLHWSNRPRLMLHEACYPITSGNTRKARSELRLRLPDVVAQCMLGDGGGPTEMGLDAWSAHTRTLLRAALNPAARMAGAAIEDAAHADEV